MDTRTYLETMKNIDRRIKNKIDEARRWREAALGKSSQDYSKERVQTSPTKDMMAQAVVNALECERVASNMAMRLIKVKSQIISQLDNMEDELYYNLLHGYYIEGKTYTQLAADEDFSYRNVKRKFEDALSAFEVKYGDTYLDK